MIPPSPIHWYRYTYSYKKRMQLTKASKLNKRKVISGSKKLSNLFVQAVNQMLECDEND